MTHRLGILRIAMLALATVGTAQAADIVTGQAWSCPATADTPDLIYVVGGIDRLGDLGLDVAPSEVDTRIVHIAIVPAKPDATRPLPAVTHMPFTQLSLIQCRGELLGMDANVPEGFGAAVEAWRGIYARGEGGYFVIPIPEAYAMAMRATAQQQQAAPQ